MPNPPGTPDLDLTLPGTAGSINGAVFMTGEQLAGTGGFGTFVQIQNNGSEQGYNTDANAQYDEKNSHNHNHSILLADVPIVFGDGTGGTLEGVAYREFLLDLNEGGGSSNPFLSLDRLQIWQQEAGNLTNFTPGSGFAGAHTNYLAYDLDAGMNRWIGLKGGGGSGQSDYRILIPDAFFINDAAHRYVTLYSQFGVQAGWNSNSGFEEWGLAGTSGGIRSALSVTKNATVPGGTADTVGEVINYTIAVSNTGNTALTGITVSDPTVSNLAAVMSGAFNVGDTNLDNQLSTGETWQYTASHTVTQFDLDTNGEGDGVIQNTVTADSLQTSPVVATATVSVDQGADVELTKTADVTSVDAAGDVITYTLTVQNDGNVSLNGVAVTDTQVNIVTPITGAPVLGPPLVVPELDGDYNVGDTNENGVEDPGETFQYFIAGDDNRNGIEDPGETFEHTNIGDTNQNGIEDPGETFQFYNIGDTDQDGEEDPGETFQFNVSHDATPVTSGGFNVGDTDMDGNLDFGESWIYTVSYTVTQDDIDNGGVVAPGLTHDNIATVTTAIGATDDASESVDIVQNPQITLVKTADVSSVDSAGDVIHYTINVSNPGNMTLTDVDVSDPSVGDLAAVESGGFNVGDLDQDGKLDLTETWQYTASYTVTQADIDNGGVVAPGLTHDNTATVTTGQGASDDDSTSVTIVQNPQVTLDKTADVTSVDAVGDVIHYTIDVSNAGNMTLTDVDVSDPSVGDLAAVESGGFNVGDLDADGKLDLTETWQFTASHTVTQAEFDAGGTIDNTASVTTDQGATDSDSTSTDVEGGVVDMAFVKAALGYHDANNNDVADAGDTIDFSFTITNNGTLTIHNIAVADNDGVVQVSGSPFDLAPGASDNTTWFGTYVLPNNNDFENTAVAQSDEISVPSTLQVVLANLIELP